MAKTGLFNASIGRKIFMAMTGLFLCLFLVGHLAGNLALFVPGKLAAHKFNEYTYFMTHNKAIKVMSYLTYASIIAHIIMAIVLTIRNRAARPTGYVKKANKSMWSSRNMGILGTLILVYLVIHMGDFWYHTKIAKDLDVYRIGVGHELENLHEQVIMQFKQLWYAVLYAVLMIPLGFHLLHGFWSGFQSLGINHPKWTPILKKTGTAFAVIIPLLFAIIPLYVHFNSAMVPYSADEIVREVEQGGQHSSTYQLSEQEIVELTNNK